MLLFTYQELAELFKTKKVYYNPILFEYFSTTCMNKLKHLTTIIYQNETEKSSNEKLELYNIIQHIDLLMNEKNTTILSFYNKYQLEEQSEKIKLIECVNILFELSMYMRGWKGIGYDYPIEEALVEQQGIVDLNTSMCLTKLENLEYYSIFGELPTINYNNGEFYVNTELTIKNRIDMIKRGDSEEENEMDTCIRVNSNYLCYTACRYMQLFNMDFPFNIVRLRYIT